MRKTGLPWLIAVFCVQTQKTLSHGIEVQIETRLQCHRTIVNP